MVNVERILEIIKSAGLGQDLSDFDIHKTFKQNSIDSLDVLTLLLAVEEGLGVKFSDEEINKIHSANVICVIPVHLFHRAHFADQINATGQAVFSP